MAHNRPIIFGNNKYSYFIKRPNFNNRNKKHLSKANKIVQCDDKIVVRKFITAAEARESYKPLPHQPAKHKQI